MEISTLVPKLVKNFDFKLVHPERKLETVNVWFVKQTNLECKRCPFGAIRLRSWQGWLRRYGSPSPAPAPPNDGGYYHLDKNAFSRSHETSYKIDSPEGRHYEHDSNETVLSVEVLRG